MQFSMTPSRAKVLAKIPDYAVDISPTIGRVTVSFHDTVIGASDDALTIEETKHTPVFYLPRSDVSMEYFQRTEHSTYCPFKGHASYWTLNIGEAVEENIVWSYEDPDPEVSALKDYLSFYTDRVTIALED